jgi:hypothetical protein
MKSIFTHVTPWENFLLIQKQGSLKPQKCPLFKNNILYLSYNRLSHKPSRKDYNWNENAPVVIFFDNNIYSQSFRFFPFDAGAVISGRFTHTDLNNKRMLNRLSFSSKTITPNSWIKSKYTSPPNYLNCKKPDLIGNDTYENSVLNTVYDSLAISNNFLDYRLTSIECQFQNPIPLSSAFTIAVPYDKKDEYARLNHHGNYNTMYYKDISLNGYLPLDLTRVSKNIFSN